MGKYEIEESALALYDGGWRKEDLEEIRAEYELTYEEAEEICEALEKIERELSA